MGKLIATFFCRSKDLLKISIVLLCILLFGLSSKTYAQFNPGKLAVLVVGDGSVFAAGTAAPVYIKEFNITGTGQSGTVRTTLPSTAVGGTTAVNRALTQNISAISEGFLNLSANRQFLTLTGYNVTSGTAGVSASSAATFPTNTRVVGKVGANAVADTRTTLHTFTSSGTRGVSTVDGSAYWLSLAAGVSYVPDANITSAVVNLDATLVRGIGIFNNQLYTSANSGAIRLAKVGTGLPTTTGQTLTNLSGFTTSTSDPYGFAFLNTDGTAGPDVVYVASSNTAPAGIVKYTSADQGATWTAKGNLTGFGVGVTAVYNSCTGSADLYILSSTAANVKPTFLYKYTDVAAGTSTLSLAISSGTLLATAAANTGFGGVAFTPASSFTLPAAYNVTGGTACTNVGVTVGLSNSEIGVSYQLMNGASPVGSAVTGTGAAIGFGVQTTVGTYTVIATNLLTGCTASMTGSATVNALPTVSITGGTSVCIGSTTTLSPITGGTWASSSNAIVTVTNAGVVTGVAAGTATFSFTQTSTGCTNTTSAVTVNARPTVSITGSTSVCVGSTTTLSPATSGTWASNNSSTATVTNAGLVTGVAAGTATFSFTQTSTGCTNTTLAVTVNALPIVSYSGLATSYCVSSGTVTLTGSPTGGTFGGPGISGNTFTPATAGVGGPYTITYTYTDGNGCTNTSSQTVTVNALPVVSFSGLPAVLCLDAASITLTGSPAGGTFSGPGINGNTFDPALAGAGGPHPITYSYTDGNGCTNTSSQTIMVNALPTVSFTGLFSSYCADATAVTLTGVPAGGIFSGPGISGSTFTAATAGVGGPYTITYSFTNGNGCTNTSSQTVNVSAVPAITGTTPATRCGTGTVVLGATGTGTGFNWYANANGGVPLGTGTNFTTPVINTTTTYYVAATNDGGNSTGGKASTNGADGTNSVGGISFTANSAFRLNAVKMYPTAAGTNTIVLYSGAGVTSGTPLFTTNYTFAAANTTTGENVTLGWEIPAGSYTIYQSVNNAGCYRDLPGGTSLPAIAYPYNIGGVVTLTYGTLPGYYYFFYNWNITTGCESPRTAVTATVTPSPVVTVSPASLSICSGNSTSTQLSVSSSNDPNYTYTWSSVPAGFTATGSGPFTVSPTATTTYNVYAQDNTSGNPSSGCGALGNTMITILPNNLSVDPTASPAAVCTGGTTQLNANTSFTPLCIPVTSCTFPDIISNVSFGSINNTTGCNGASTGGFTYFAAPNPTIIAGTSVPLSVTTGGDLEGAAVWIDYDHNGNFEPSEQLLNGFLGTVPATYTATVSIPLTALNGITRMRVRCRFNANPNSLANPACTDVTFGETEDYAITISGGVDPGPDNLTYDWSANPTSLSATNISNPQATGVNTAQTYTVTVTDPSTGCVKSGSINVPLSIPTAVISTGTTNCSNVAIQLIATATAGSGGGSVTSYQWSLNGNPIPGATLASYDATATGSYLVSVTNDLGCTATSDPYVLTALNTNTALNGTYTINSSLPASCTNYISMASAISDLNTKGVSGNVLFNVASGHTETAPAGGLMINYCSLNASLKPSASQTVAFQGGTTAAVITAPVGTSTSVDGIIKLVGADYITFDKIDLQESAANTNATTQMEWGYALLKCDGNNGSGHNTIAHCSITLNKANTISRGIYSGNHNAVATTGLSYSGTAGNFAQVDSSRNGYNSFYANSIQNVYTAISINGNSASSGTHSLNDTLNVIGITGQGNTISNFGGGSVAAIGITETNQRDLKVNGNTISGGTGNTSTVTGISLLSGVGIEIKDNTISLSSAATASSIIGITCAFSGGTAAFPQTVTITGNTIQNTNHSTATSGSFTGITSGSGGTGSIVSISSNSILNNTLTGTGSLNAIINTGSPETLTMSNNIITGNTKAGSGTMTLLDAASATLTTMAANQVTGNQVNGASGTFYCTRASNSQVSYNGNTVNNNSIPSTSGASASSLYGYYNAGSPTMDNLTNNSIDNLSIGGTSTSNSNILYGLYSNTIASTTKNISENNIHSLSMSVAGSLYGINSLTGIVNIYKNKIYDLGSAAASAAVQVEGIRIGSGTAIQIYNNLVGNLTATATSSSDAVRGIDLSSTTPTSTIGIYFNTIFLTGTSSVTGFGSSGIYHTTNATASTAALDMRNNIVINNCVPTGTGRAVAYRRSNTTLANFATSSNNNIYHVDGSANTYVFSDGTNHLDISGYKSFTGISPRETNSQAENVAFQSTAGAAAAFLKVNTGTPTFVEHGAQPISGITDDYFGTVRNTSYPDIGAHEDNFPNYGPILTGITITPSTPKCVATARAITATIIPGSVPASSVTIFYSYAGVAQTPVVMTGGPTTYIGTLPAAPSPNVLVTWGVTVTYGANSNSLTGTPFTDAYLTGTTLLAADSSESICAGSSIVLSAAVISPAVATPAANTYCTSLHSSGCSNDNITKVVLGNINNNTSGCGGSSHYTYFSGGGTQTTGLQAAIPQSLAVSFGSDASQYFGAWIDYNHNGVYDASEFLGASANAGSNGTAAVSFTVPLTGYNGLTHMRIVGGNDDPVTAIQACGASSSNFGETQDYDVTISNATPGFAQPVTYSWKDAANTIVSTGNAATVAPPATTFYRLTITDANGCQLTSNTIFAGVISKPVVTALGPTSFCTGGSVNLSVSVPAVSNASLQFDGVDDYAIITIAQLPLGNSVRTLEAWVKTTQTDLGNIMNWGTASSNQRCGLMVYESKLYFVGQDNDLQGNITINDGQWHHVAASFDGTTMSLYVDGVLDVSSEMTLNTVGNIMRIGKKVNTPTEYFSGEVDEVRTWNIARSQQEIQQQKNFVLPSNMPGLVAYFKMNEGLGTTTQNAVNNAPATLTFGPVWNTTATTPLNTNPVAYLWSNGETNPIIAVTNSGNYSVQATYDGAATCTSTPIQVNATVPYVFVDGSVTASGDGSSWATAYKTLQEALESCGVQEIWVKAGTYKPTKDALGNASPTDPRDKTFHLLNGIRIYGGFNGTETLLSQRDPVANITILSGDFNNDDVVTGTGATLAIANNSENAYHVVLSVSDLGTTILDGFTVKGGNANGTTSVTVESLAISRGRGAGIYNAGSSPSLNKMILSANSSTVGGGMYNSNSSPSISNSQFNLNLAVAASSFGAGMCNLTSSPTITNCGFTGNRNVTQSGGGIYNQASFPVITGSTFSGNASVFGGAMLNNTSSVAVITNSSFIANTATTYGGAINNAGTSNSSITNCSFSNNTAPTGGAMYNSGSNPIVTGTHFTNNTAPNFGGAVFNTAASPVFNSCRFIGNSAANGGGAVNIEGATSNTATFTDCIFRNNIASDGATLGTGGAIQLVSLPAIANITNCVFSGNQAQGTVDDGGGAIMIYGGTVNLANSTIEGSVSATRGGAVSININSAVLNIKNSILWNNTAAVSNDIANAVAATANISYSMIGGATCPANVTCGAGMIYNTNPLFVNAADPDGADDIWGTTDDGLNLGCSSPAYNSGTNTGAPATDIVGTSRPQFGTVDMGAYESATQFLNASVNISANPGNNICAGSAVTFTAIPINGGTNPAYQWYKGANPISGETGSSYTSSTLVGGDVISVKLTSNACVAVNPVTSNAITISTYSIATPVINTSGPTNLCGGGSVTLSTPVNAGSMLLFNGTDNYVSGPEDVVPVTGDYTVSVWAKQLNSHPGQYSQIFAQGRQLYLGPGADGIIRAGDSWLNTGVPFPTDQQWHHYTIVRTSTNTYLYLDGNLAATKGSPIPSPASNGIDPNNLMIGSQWFPGEIFDGYVDELQVWNVARTQSEIQAGMHLSQLNNAPGLVAYFTFNEGTGSLTTDITANGYAATLVNNPAWSASTALPSIQWNLNGSPISGETGASYIANAAGNYTVTLTSSQGCVATSAVTSVTVNTCPNFATLNLKLFIQGYYQSTGTTAPMDNFGEGGCLFKNGLSANATDADNVEVSLIDADDGSLIESQNGVLQTNGTMSLNFAASRSGNSYYLRIRHRNSIETWSAAPVEMSATTDYDFTTAANMAYGDNQVEVETGVWAIYSGDIIDADTQTPGVQDGVIESSDYSLMENDVYNVTAGYVPADITGDGVVESADYSIMENNVYLVIAVLRPF